MSEDFDELFDSSILESLEGALQEFSQLNSTTENDSDEQNGTDEEDEGIKFELDALGLMREMSPKEYDELTKQLEDKTFMFVGHKKNTLVYFGCKQVIKRGNEYLQENIPGAKIVQVVITDQLANNKVPEIAPLRTELKYQPLNTGPFGESIGSISVV